MAGFSHVISWGSARDLLNPNGSDHLPVIDACHHIYRPKSVVSKDYMPHPIEIPDGDRFVELRASAKKMNIHCWISYSSMALVGSISSISAWQMDVK